MKRRTKTLVTSLFAAVLALIISVTAFPTEVMAAANKGVKLKVSFNGKKSTTDEIWAQNTYSISTPLSKKMKLKKGTVISYKVLVPKKLLKKNNDTLLFCTNLVFCNDYDKKQDIYSTEGYINETNWCKITKDGKNVYLCVYDEKTDKDSKRVTAGKKVKKSGKASIQEKGDYYVLTMSHTMPNKYKNYIWDEKNEKTIIKTKTINTKKNYWIIPEFVVHGECSKLSGYIYLDEITVKAGSTKKITYSDAKAHNNIVASHFGGKKWNTKNNCKVVKLPF